MQDFVILRNREITKSKKVIKHLLPNYIDLLPNLICILVSKNRFWLKNHSSLKNNVLGKIVSLLSIVHDIKGKESTDHQRVR